MISDTNASVWRRLLVLLLLVSIAGLVGCGAPPHSSGPVSSPDALGREEVERFAEAHPGASVYDLVLHKRRYWLIRRSSVPDAHSIGVFDEAGTWLGAPHELRRIGLAEVRWVTFLPSRLAVARFGRYQPAFEGAIVVSFG